MLRPVMEKAAGIRRAGAAALDMAYTAAGRFDGFFELGLKPWDVAAGSLLVTEAGGLVGDFSGNANYLEGEQVLAGAPKVFSAMIPLLNPGRREEAQAVIDIDAAAPRRASRSGAGSSRRLPDSVERAARQFEAPPARAVSVVHTAIRMAVDHRRQVHRAGCPPRCSPTQPATGRG